MALGLEHHLNIMGVIVNKTDVSFTINASSMSGHILIAENGSAKIINRYGEFVCSFRLSDLAVNLRGYD